MKRLKVVFAWQKDDIHYFEISFSGIRGAILIISIVI
jgi:hypothetical protein